MRAYAGFESGDSESNALLIASWCVGTTRAVASTVDHCGENTVVAGVRAVVAERALCAAAACAIVALLGLLRARRRRGLMESCEEPRAPASSRTLLPLAHT